MMHPEAKVASIDDCYFAIDSESLEGNAIRVLVWVRAEKDLWIVIQNGRHLLLFSRESGLRRKLDLENDDEIKMMYFDKKRLELYID